MKENTSWEKKYERKNIDLSLVSNYKCIRKYARRNPIVFLSYKLGINIPNRSNSLKYFTINIPVNFINNVLRKKDNYIFYYNKYYSLLRYQFFWGQIEGSSAPLSQEDTTIFVYETLNGYKPNETTLYYKIKKNAHNYVTRYLGKDENRELIDSLMKVEKYQEKVLRLSNSISDYGLLQIASVNKKNLRYQSRDERDITVVLNSNGFYLYQTGHHRLAIAKYFGIEEAPCLVHNISFYLLKP